MFKSNGGFTLVELIVVIAILAILAGVAVPAYSAYIDNANKAADDAKIETIETAMASALAMKGLNLEEDGVTYFAITTANGKTTISIPTALASDETAEAIFAQYESFGGATEVTFQHYSKLEWAAVGNSTTLKELKASK